MLKCLVKTFSRKLILPQTLNNEVLHPQKWLATQFRNISTDGNGSAYKQSPSRSPLDADDYITPYSLTKETHRGARKILADSLLASYKMTEKQLETLLNNDAIKRSPREFNKSIDILMMNGVSKASVLEYPWVVAIDPKILQKKVNLIRSLNVRDFNDFVPFLKLSPLRLTKLVNFLKREAVLLEQENRIYFISERLTVEPKIVSKFLSKRLFILEMPLELLVANLDNMIKYVVEPLNILKDLWAFRYTPKSVKSRLERAKVAKKEKIMPWMVRCPERILERSLQLSVEEKALLGEHSNVIEYVASRLGFSPECTKAIMSKHPAVHSVRVPKIKEVLDYLLNEAKFTPHDIANVPRILCHSLETTKERLKELESVGCRPSSLVIVCKSRREYEKFVNAWCGARKKLQERSKSNKNSETC